MALEILHNNVWVLLDEESEHSVIDGIIVPLFEATETDGGKPTTRLSKKSFLLKGTVKGVGNQVNIPLSIGDKVYVKQEAYSIHFQFFPSRDRKVLDFTGDILIPVQFIEAVYDRAPRIVEE